MIVKTILRQKVRIDRITHRDAQTYFAILLDDNNRKTICRFYLGNKKQIAFLDEQKKENKIDLSGLDDIFSYTEMLYKALENYEKV